MRHQEAEKHHRGAKRRDATGKDVAVEGYPGGGGRRGGGEKVQGEGKEEEEGNRTGAHGGREEIGFFFYFFFRRKKKFAICSVINLLMTHVDDAIVGFEFEGLVLWVFFWKVFGECGREN